MIGKRIHRTCGALVLALALAVLPSAGQGAMWVGAQLGANFVDRTDFKVDANGNNVFRYNGAAVEPAVMGGLTIGYDFIREGFLGYNWPDWMKYFSFATDFTFNRCDVRQQGIIGGGPFVGFPLPRAEGAMAVWSFLFIGKYGFFPDSEVPFGRLVPYVGVGPGIVFSSLNADLTNQSASSVDIALVAEAGVRFMALKNVSIDAAWRYRWCKPSYSYNVGGTNVNIDLSDVNQFSAIARANYHF